MGARKSLCFFDFYRFFFVDTCHMFLKELLLWCFIQAKVTVKYYPFTFCSVITKRVKWNLFPADFTSLFLVNLFM